MRVKNRLALSRIRLAAAATTMLALLLLPAGAGAFAFPAGSPFTNAAPVITNFPSCPANEFEAGPIGLLNDGFHFFVTDTCNETTYRFPSAGGNAGAPEVSLKAGLQGGIALSNGTYFAIGHWKKAAIPPGLYSFSPVTLALGAGQPPPLAVPPGLQYNDVVADPLSTDLYVSGEAGIFRIQNPAAPKPTITQITEGSYDGLDFTENGSLLWGANQTNNKVAGFERKGGAIGGPAFIELPLPAPLGAKPSIPDGIAVARPNSTENGVNVSNNVFVNSNNGSIERIDVNNGYAVSIAAEGGTRGDFETVGPERCLYVTQSSTIEKMTPCFLQPPADDPPQFGRCLKVGAGRFANAGCTKEEGRTKHYEWYPAFGGPEPLAETGFTFAANTSKTLPALETKNKTKITCTGQSGTGEYTGTKTVGSVTLTFRGCESQSQICTTAGAAEGEIIAAGLRGELGIIEKASEPLRNKLGLDLEPTSGELEFSCGASAFKVQGSVIVMLKTNKMSLTQTLKYVAKAGVQKPANFESDATEMLKASLNGGPFEATGLNLVTVQSNEERVEVNSVV